jgi:pimeloyl-ACP methyl ester carboxylesterase
VNDSSLFEAIEVSTSATRPFERHRLDTSAIEIAYLRRAGSGPSIVGLHGLFGSGACLLPLAEALAGDLDIILPDARGHGGTGPPAQGPQDGGNSLLKQGCRENGWR